MQFFVDIGIHDLDHGGDARVARGKASQHLLFTVLAVSDIALDKFFGVRNTRSVRGPVKLIIAC